MGIRIALEPSMAQAQNHLTIASTLTTRPDTQSASLNPSSRLRARLGLQVKRMLA